MCGSTLDLPPRAKKELRWLQRGTKEPGLAMRCQMILLADEGYASRAIAEAIGCDRACVSGTTDLTATE